MQIKNKTLVFQSENSFYSKMNFEVEYWLFETGRKTIAEVWLLNSNYDRLVPMYINRLAASEKTAHYELYTEILAAMDNNAETVMEEEGFAETKSNY